MYLQETMTRQDHRVLTPSSVLGDAAEPVDVCRQRALQGSSASLRVLGMLWASAQTYEALEAEMAQQAVEELVNQTKSGRQVLVGHSCDPGHNHDPEIFRGRSRSTAYMIKVLLDSPYAILEIIELSIQCFILCRPAFRIRTCLVKPFVRVLELPLDVGKVIGGRRFSRANCSTINASRARRIPADVAIIVLVNCTVFSRIRFSSRRVAKGINV